MTEDRTSPGRRVGWGFDAHQLTGVPPLILAGVIVSETLGVEATSDGDVLAHAVTDAVLGACTQGDIGEHFPSDDPVMDGAESLFLLRQVATMAIAWGWRPVHLDSTVVAEGFRVAPHREAMRSNLADALGMGIDDVSVKATSTDGLGFIGRGEGLAAVAVVTVEALS